MFIFIDLTSTFSQLKTKKKNKKKIPNNKTKKNILPKLNFTNVGNRLFNFFPLKHEYIARVSE